MALYADEDDVWKCPEHPSRRRNVGVCPACLREKLSALCPECASLLPCNCCSASSCSSSSSMSFISIPGDANFSESAGAGSVGSIGRVSSLIDSEQSYRRSRSVALPFLKSARFPSTGEFVDPRESSASTEKSKPSIWLFFWPQKSKREKIAADVEEDDAADLKIRTIRRSKSVAAPISFSCAGGVQDEARSVKSKGWYFPSPMKVFRHSRASAKIVQERSPLHREKRYIKAEIDLIFQCLKDQFRRTDPTLEIRPRTG
ncbi:hypothetical protein V2J09_014803 [Rumex salicifolius]